MDDDNNEFLDDLILSGAIEVHAVDGDGNFMYTVTSKMDDFDPNFRKRMIEIFSMELRLLWQLGFLNLDITQENPLVTVTSKIFDEEAIEKLHPRLQETLRYLIEALKK